MDFNIPTGTSGNQTKRVLEEDTAQKVGSGLAAVYATPAMIAFMEKTAFLSIEDLLPEGYSSVGIQINVAHKKASLPGAEIRCTSEVTKVDGKKVFFTISASDENGEIGTAEHIRFIINSEAFMDALKK